MFGEFDLFLQLDGKPISEASSVLVNNGFSENWFDPYLEELESILLTIKIYGDDQDESILTILPQTNDAIFIGFKSPTDGYSFFRILNSRSGEPIHCKLTDLCSSKFFTVDILGTVGTGLRIVDRWFWYLEDTKWKVMFNLPCSCFLNITERKPSIELDLRDVSCQMDTRGMSFKFKYEYVFHPVRGKRNTYELVSNWIQNRGLDNDSIESLQGLSFDLVGELDNKSKVEAEQALETAFGISFNK